MVFIIKRNVIIVMELENYIQKAAKNARARGSKESPLCIQFRYHLVSQKRLCYPYRVKI